ncbi:MAG: UDP-2,3-diacylglucosamine diphosphatase [Burkholderiaceae bacterium]|jgi:UDP-2,3-diacylglucosamine hydrolase|nr:UDP-2,3-diacylglucosamine diphosphatase [Burkholderiaceae bacterium]
MQSGTAEKPSRNPTKSQALFVSDIHLAESRPNTTNAFLDFMAHQARQSGRLYILGDLFEYWAGDDDIENAWNHRILEAMRQLSLTGTAVFWMPGNRDFLTGERFAAESGAVFLPDLHDDVFGELKIAMAHGDAQCLEDTDYVKFRMMVRNPQWQQQFLAQPLEKRKAIIESFRKDNHKTNETKPDTVWDVTPSAIDEVFSRTGASTFIHGHTHRPGIHEHGGKKRYVLPDWDLDSAQARGGWLELTASGKFVPHPVNSTI